MSGTVGKYIFGSAAQWGGSRDYGKGFKVILYGTAVAGVGIAAWGSYLSSTRDAQSRLRYGISLNGEYCQPSHLIGHPPLNLNLPPHLRTDMKSYLDLPETQIKPPPTWDEVDEYVKFRLTDLMLDPAYTQFTYNEAEPRWAVVAPWGSLPVEEARGWKLSYIRRASQSVLHSQGKKKVTEEPIEE